MSASLVLDSLQEPFRTAIRVASAAWAEALGERLLSIALFGSVARRSAGPGSDIDVLVVAREFARSLADRRRPLLEAWERARLERALPETEWNIVAKSPDEALFHSPLYLDIVEDGVLLFDRDGFFEKVLAEMRARMQTLGSRRIFLEDGSWYWDLKPGFRFGEVVEI